jgi:hypothetical protein
MRPAGFGDPLGTIGGLVRVGASGPDDTAGQALGYEFGPVVLVELDVGADAGEVE